MSLRSIIRLAAHRGATHSMESRPVLARAGVCGFARLTRAARHRSHFELLAHERLEPGKAFHRLE
jgi:hypothetical protein